jgi:hypothetical protein
MSVPPLPILGLLVNEMRLHIHPLKVGDSLAKNDSNGQFAPLFSTVTDIGAPATLARSG